MIKTFESFDKNNIVVKDSKVIVPVYLYDLDNKTIDIITKGKKELKDNPFIYYNLRELNKIIMKDMGFCYGIDEVLQWLKKYIEININDEYEDCYQTDINKIIDKFFKYMPFITNRAEGMLFSDLELGYCCDDCDGPLNNYMRMNFERHLKNFISDLKNAIKIKNTLYE